MTVPLSDAQLAALFALLTNQHVTPLPWIADSHEIHRADSSGTIKLDEWIGETCNVELPDRGEANAALAVAAVNALPELIAEVQRLRAESEQHIRAQVADDIDAFARAAGRAVDPMKVGYLGGMAIAATIARGEHPGFAELTADLRRAAPADPCGAEPVHQTGRPAGGGQ